MFVEKFRKNSAALLAQAWDVSFTFPRTTHQSVSRNLTMSPHPIQEMPCQKWLSIKEIYISAQFIGIHSQIALFQMLMLDVHMSRTDKLVFHSSS